MAKQTESTNHEIDLDKVSKKVKSVISGINDSVFDGILFIKKNIIVLVVLILIGAGYGYYKDANSKIYEHSILVTPNFGSVDYLYEQIKSTNAKIKEGDTVFFNKLGISSSNIGRIQIEPVVDIYNYVTEENGINIIQRENVKFSLFRQIADKRDMTEVLEEQVTAKNYKNHLITITTVGTISKEETVQPLIDYLNSSSYFKDVQKEAVKSLEVKIAENDSMVKQADAILNHLSEKGGNASNLVLLNEKTGLNDILVIKDQLIRLQANNRLKKIDYSSIIKETGMLLNNKKHSLITGKMKFIYPALLLLAFFAVMAFRGYYIRQVNKRKVIIQE